MTRYWRRRIEHERRIYNRFCKGKRGVGMILTRRLRDDLERRMTRRNNVPIGVRLPVAM